MQRPNLLVLYTDQQRWDALGANGNRDIKTPHLDRFAAGAVNFDHCFVQNPVCMPSRASFLTGRYPSALGITQMGVPMPENIPNFATLFGTYGYHSANIGKLHFLPHANRDHTRPHPSFGFHHLEISDEPGVYEDAYRAWVRQVAPDQLAHLSLGLPPARKVWLEVMGCADPVAHPPAPSTGGRFDFNGPVSFPGRDDVTHSAFVCERTTEFLRRQAAGDRPFACIAGFYSPHAPWVVPRKYLDRYDPARFVLPSVPSGTTGTAGGTERHTQLTLPSDAERLRRARHGYYAMVSEVDDCVGRLLSVLEETGLAANTIVVFTSDHGDWLGEHGKWGKGFPAHDACSRVPLILRVPGKAPRTVSNLVEAVDVLPTLLELAGLPVPTTMQGRSLVKQMEGDVEGSVRTSALTEHHGWRSLRTRHHRYVIASDGREAFFDLRRESGEYSDLAHAPESAPDLSAHRHELAVRMLGAELPLDRTWSY